MNILYCDNEIIVCEKPRRILSTDEPGGMPSLVRDALGDSRADVRTVHRLDQVVGGVMVLARSADAASELSRQIRENVFAKEYLAVVHGMIPEMSGNFRDLLYRDKAQRKTYIVQEPGKGVQEALLRYETLFCTENMTCVRIFLETGRTHQIRAQFSGRGYPLIGDRKYSLLQDDCEIALWSSRLSFLHPISGKQMSFSLRPPEEYPWNECKIP